MILTKSHTPAPLLVPPKVGIKHAARHLRNNSSRFRHFRSSINPSADNRVLELPLNLEKPRMAISVEQHRIRLMLLDEAMRFKADDYRFTARLALHTTHSDVAAALDNGALPYLASLQIQVRRVNQMSAASHPATASDLTSVFRDMDEDARAIFRIIVDAKAQCGSSKPEHSATAHQGQVECPSHSLTARPVQ